MWILYWAGKPCAWLCGNTATTIGRKGAVLTVTDDPSISRLHLTVTVGISAVAVPAPLTLTDNSKYGTVVRITAGGGGVTGSGAGGGDGAGTTSADVKLQPGKDWQPSSLATKLAIDLGTHGAQFNCEWQPCGVAFVGIAAGSAAEAELAELVHLCGAHRVVATNPLDAVAAATLVLTPAVEPLAQTVAALCLSKPIVGPGYFRAIQNRLTPKVPPPDPAVIASLPPNIDPIWASLVKDLASSSSGPTANAVAAIDPNTFLPRRERGAIFSGLSFLCIQEPLFKELNAYVPFAGGRVFYDAPPVTSAATARTASLRDAFRPYATRHQGQVIAFTPLTTLNTVAIDVLRSLGVAAVEYTDIVRSVLRATRLDVAAASAMTAAVPESVATTSDSKPRQEQQQKASPSKAAVTVAQPGLGAADLLHVDDDEPLIVPPPRTTTTTSPGKGGNNEPQQQLGPAVSPNGRRRGRNEAPLGAQSLYELDRQTQQQQPRPALPAAGGGDPTNTRSSVEGNSARGGRDDENEAGILYEDNVMLNGPPRLPRYPCFVEPHQRRPVDGADGDRAAQRPTNQKCFVKQRIVDTAAAEYEAMETVGLDAAREAAAAALPLHQRAAAVVARVDALDVIPNFGGFDDVGGPGGFGAIGFGAAASGGARAPRRAAGAAGAAGAAAGRSSAAHSSRAAAPAAAANEANGIVDGDFDVAVVEDVSSPARAPAPTRSKRAPRKAPVAPDARSTVAAALPLPGAGGGISGGGGIFDLDALY